MHKPISLNEARSICMMLCKGDSPPSTEELHIAGGSVINFAMTAAMLNCLEALPADLRRCRAMLCCELMRHDGPRENVLNAVINRHEQLAMELRLQPLLDQLPSLAVYRAKLYRSKQPAISREEKQRVVKELTDGLRH